MKSATRTSALFFASMVVVACGGSSAPPPQQPQPLYGPPAGNPNAARSAGPADTNVVGHAPHDNARSQSQPLRPRTP